MLNPLWVSSPFGGVGTARGRGCLFPWKKESFVIAEPGGRTSIEGKKRGEMRGKKSKKRQSPAGGNGDSVAFRIFLFPSISRPLCVTLFLSMCKPFDVHFCGISKIYRERETAFAYLLADKYCPNLIAVDCLSDL